MDSGVVLVRFGQFWYCRYLKFVPIVVTEFGIYSVDGVVRLEHPANCWFLKWFPMVVIEFGMDSGVVFVRLMQLEYCLLLKFHVILDLIFEYDSNSVFVRYVQSAYWFDLNSASMLESGIVFSLNVLISFMGDVMEVLMHMQYI